MPRRREPAQSGPRRGRSAARGRGRPAASDAAPDAAGRIYGEMLAEAAGAAIAEPVRPGPGPSRGRTSGRGRTRHASDASDDDIDDSLLYDEMLIEEASSASEEPERPLKRPRTLSAAAVRERDRERFRNRAEADAAVEARKTIDPIPSPIVQTLYDDEGDSDDSDEDVEFEDVAIGDGTAPGLSSSSSSSPAPEATFLRLDLAKHLAATSSRKRDAAGRRKPLTRDDKKHRLQIHTMHLLCLLVHCARRNSWCNDPVVQGRLRPLATPKMVQYLVPWNRPLSQFAKSNSLRNGLPTAHSLWRDKFRITERGLRRALWAESPQHLSNYKLPDDMDSCVDVSEFRKAATSLQGSRDVGAQLYCALLRSIGVEARLVCSLQPLGAAAGAPVLPPPAESTSGGPSANAPRRAAPSDVPDFRESPHPVFWVEVLDVAYQKWRPTDPVATDKSWNPRPLEPPSSDRENCLSYVVAFHADGSARDVTRRYAKAYLAKTLRLRVETLWPRVGERWWRRVLRRFRPRGLDGLGPDDERLTLDQIEDSELTEIVAREPMPRGVADFKDHPVFALLRHLRRAEALMPGAAPAGTLKVGPQRGSVERVYRRADVRVVCSADKWYRLGRVVKPGETPLKVLPRRRASAGTPRGRRKDDDEDDDDDDDDDDADAGRAPADTPLFALHQTELYQPPPVVDGIIPKNKFRNVEIFAPTMVPPGGAHVPGRNAARAAFLVGVDYAPALTGFRFSGRHGTAVMDGVVVAAEFADAVRAVVDGLENLETEAEAERRTARALAMWRRFLLSLRIYARVGAIGDENGEEHETQGKEDEMHEEVDEIVGRNDDGDTEMASGGGGFLEDDDDYGDDYGGGGFIVG